MQKKGTKCGAKTRSGTPCKNGAMLNGRCRMHGGKSLGGVASPHYKNGRHSKYLPSRLSSDYNRSINDPQLLELRSEIALVDGRLADMLQRVDTGESGIIWRDLGKAWDSFEVAVAEGNKDKQRAHLAELKGLISRGRGDYAAWAEIGGLLEQRRKLVESERKRIVEAQQFITAQQAMALMGAVLGIIKENVDDRNTLQAISSGINNLVAANAV